ncbi:MAG: alpha/beta fold hydrolase [Firmicutes bacterium]|nr:alpha/beta fold hydrolase [Bacillota bacterium]
MVEEYSVHPQARPYSFPGREVGCLLVHGFTGSPPELRSLGDHLAARGWAVEAPLLKGHGTRVADLANTTWRDWMESAREGLVRLRSQPVRDVFLIGMSMGGLLCLYLADALGDVSGVVTLNTPIWLRDRRTAFAPLLRLVNQVNPRWLAEIPKRKGEAGAARGERFGYDSVHPRAMTEMLGLVREVRRLLGRVKVPVLIVQSHADETAEPKSAGYLYDSLGSADKQVLWLTEAPHLLFEGSEAGMVREAVENFILKRTAPDPK